MTTVKKPKPADTNGKSVKKTTGRQQVVDAPSNRMTLAMQEAIRLSPIEYRWIEAILCGNEILTNAFGKLKLDEIQEEMTNPKVKQGKGAPKKRRDPEAEMRNASHVCDGSYSEDGYAESLCGFPAIGLKKAFARMAHEYAGAVMKNMIRHTFFSGLYKGLIPIYGNPIATDSKVKGRPAVPTLRRDAVPNGKGQCTLVFRPSFGPWFMRVQCRYVASHIDLNSFINVLAAAGQLAGIGSFRHENGGECGLFHIHGKIKQLPNDYIPEQQPIIIQ